MWNSSSKDEGGRANTPSDIDDDGISGKAGPPKTWIIHIERIIAEVQRDAPDKAAPGGSRLVLQAIANENLVFRPAFWGKSYQSKRNLSVLAEMFQGEAFGSIECAVVGSVKTSLRYAEPLKASSVLLKSCQSPVQYYEHVLHQDKGRYAKSTLVSTVWTEGIC